ncbi:SDR family NAD(P)-dependent oxidoreductase [Falsiroseomonas tokyonensis]|uniref:SDR family NAD(P)-dependent oxidoreductase n=1 Tax=Falsiroseomonas tokyonensis TaxID=430521 RepID=A0ABV7BRP8_9PROT|nr:SDR family oxidoreductase [Falsiroseomonas tokyonensis]MBU8537701.1 SDR family oxidoreductase [Falsiroseomonas tokyonensis]
MQAGTIQGRTALVTGGGSGIGAACAAALTAAGARVTVLGRREAPLRARVAAGDAAVHIAADINALPALPRFDILLHAAGAAESALFLKSDAALFDRMWRVNVMGAVAVTQAVLPGMIEAGFGRVVMVASTASLKGYPYVTAYAAAKHGLLGLVRSLAQEVATKGVTVNAICPGFTETDIVAESVARIMAKTGRDEAAARAELAKHNPQRRLVQPAEVAAAALALCWPGSGAINGQAIAVDGGET